MKLFLRNLGIRKFAVKLNKSTIFSNAKVAFSNSDSPENVFFYGRMANKLGQMTSYIKDIPQSISYCGPSIKEFLPMIPKQLENLILCNIDDEILLQEYEKVKNKVKNINICNINTNKFNIKSDYAIFNFSLILVENFEEYLKSILEKLNIGGSILFSLPVNQTFSELFQSYALAELEREGGMSPTITKIPNVHDIQASLENAGFEEITLDVDRFVLTFETFFHYLNFLETIGASNPLEENRPTKSRETFLAAASIYSEMFNIKKFPISNQFLSEKFLKFDTNFLQEESIETFLKNNKEEFITAKFEILYGIGWKLSNIPKEKKANDYKNTTPLHNQEIIKKLLREKGLPDEFNYGVIN